MVEKVLPKAQQACVHKARLLYVRVSKKNGSTFCIANFCGGGTTKIDSPIRPEWAPAGGGGSVTRGDRAPAAALGTRQCHVAPIGQEPLRRCRGDVVLGLAGVPGAWLGPTREDTAPGRKMFLPSYFAFKGPPLLIS